MALKALNGDEAMARGALSAGVRMVTSYPGSPSSGTVEALIAAAPEHGLYVEWSGNERVAVEMAIGASIAGRRALVGTKSVGMNVMVDPLMALNLTPVHGGLVILLGDDPGAYGSQNDQDTRALASLLEMPMLEPASPAEGYAMMRQSFAASERFQSAVIVRETRGFIQQVEPVEIDEGPTRQGGLGLAREPWRFVPSPSNAVAKHRDLHAKIVALGEWADQLPFNRIRGIGSKGLVAAGFAYRKALDVLGDEPPAGLRLLKLSSLHPLPRRLIAEFLSGCEEVLVLEEIEPYVESRLKAIAYDLGSATKIYGKESRHVEGREGELFRWQIGQALEKFVPEISPARTFSPENEEAEKPRRESYCAGCDYGRILDLLAQAAESLQQKPVLVGDPGCLVTVAGRLDAKYAIGSAVAVADGLSKAGVRERAVAIFGDSSFFHSSLPAICNAVHHGSDILMVVLDNGTIATTGFQPHPGVGHDALGRPAPALNIAEIARACGVPSVHCTAPDDPDAKLRELFHDALRRRELTLLIVGAECKKPGS